MTKSKTLMLGLCAGLCLFLTRCTTNTSTSEKAMPSTESSDVQESAPEVPVFDGPVLDGHQYSFVKIGAQDWFTENLMSKTYANGDVILTDQTRDVEDMRKRRGVQNAYFYQEGSKVLEHGRLYSGYAVQDARGLCPTGWRVPSDEDWSELEVALGMSREKAFSQENGTRGSEALQIGNKLKTVDGWLSSDPAVGRGTDEVGFAGRAAGWQEDGGGFYGRGVNGNWWSSTLAHEKGVSMVSRSISTRTSGMSRSRSFTKELYSVRCVRDAE